MSPRMTIWALNVAHFADHFVLLIFPTAVLSIGPAWGLDYGAALALGTPAFAAFAIGTLPSGWLGDRMDRALLIAIFLTGAGASCLVLAVSWDPLSMMAGFVLLGLFASIYHPVGLALLTEIAERPGRALAVNGVFGNLGIAGAALTTGLLTDWLSWRAAFAIPGGLLVVLGLAYGSQVLAHRRGLREPTRRPGGRVASHPLSGPTLVRLFGVIALVALVGGLVFHGVTVTMPKLFDGRLSGGGSVALAGGFSALVFAIGAFAQLPVGDLLDRIGARPVLIAVLSMQAIALVAVSQADGYWTVPAATFLVLLVFAQIPITTWLVGRHVASRFRSRVFALEYVLSLGVGSSAIPLLAWIHTVGLGFDVQFLGFAAGVALLVLVATQLPAPVRAARA